jgi:tripeptidyl-peptidase I
MILSVNPGSTVFEPESACEQVIYSGGGFSNHFRIPKYQRKAVSGYLKHHRPSYAKDIYNSTGRSRAYPDLSANGANYVISVSQTVAAYFVAPPRRCLCTSQILGNFTPVFGTSASTPVVGAILTLVNDARLVAGKGPIGFVNPTVRQLPSIILT